MPDYGTAFLEKLLRYYGQRLRKAKARGYDVAGTGYHWLYCELELRVDTIHMVHDFLGLLPQYLARSDVERTLALAVQYLGAWFMEKTTGPLPHDERGNCTYFSEENPYWQEVQAAGDYIGSDMDQTDQLQCQKSISSYVICCLRLYLYLREQQFQAIDRGRFDQLMAPVGSTAA